MNSLTSSLPQIIPRPDFPKPKTSRIADDLAYSMINTYRMKSGPNRVVKLWKTHHYGAVLLFKEFKLAIFLYGQDSRERSIRYLYLHEPPEEEKVISRFVLFDRFNALLKPIGRPTLHEIVNNYWIFSDGVPWVGQRLFRWKERYDFKSEKEILNDILAHP